MNRFRAISASTGMVKYVLLGGGQAGGYAAAEFVKNGLKPGELTIITSEPVVSYERPTLSKGYLNPEGAPRLPGFHACVGGGGDKQTEDWYKEKGIDYKTSTTVTSVDVQNKSLKTEGGESISYDKLILALGATNMTMKQFGTPGAELDGVNYLRNVADADGLVADMKEAKKISDQAVVVGGGYIGMECSAGLVKNGFKVHMIFPEDNLMSRLFTPEIAAFYESYYEKQGVTLIKGDTVTEFHGNGRVKEVKTKSGKTVPCSICIVGVGARPNTGLFKDQLEVLDKAPGGVKVNSQLQTSNPDVYAVGDIAAFPLTLYGNKLNRQEHVTNARLSAAHAVKAIYGSQEPYEYLPFFYSREFDLSWQFYGVNEGESVLFGEPGKGKFGAYWVNDGKVMGCFSESASAEENAALKKVAKAQPKAPSMDELRQQGFNFANKV